jgi:copper resistance protein D
MLVGSFHAFVTTPYGRLLTVKIVLFTGMIALASLNRFRLVPRLRRSDEVIVPLRTLLRSVVFEQTLGLALLAVVAVLGTWAPAVDAMSM